MALFGDLLIPKNQLVSWTSKDEYNIVTGSRSSQFLGRKSRTGVLRISYRGGNSRQKVQVWQDIADTGIPRGLILVGSKVEGIFGISTIDILFKQEINSVITRMVIDVNLVEDSGQQIR